MKKPESPRRKEEDAGAKREKRAMLARKASIKELALDVRLGPARPFRRLFRLLQLALTESCCSSIALRGMPELMKKVVSNSITPPDHLPEKLHVAPEGQSSRDVAVDQLMVPSAPSAPSSQLSTRSEKRKTISNAHQLASGSLSDAS